MLSVDPTLPLPVYEQIRGQIVRMIAAGTLGPGHRLPTIRQLAVDLGLAKGTVARAYELLESDGVIETLGRKGSFVVETPPVSAADRATELAQAAESLVVTARQLGADLDEVRRALDSAWQRF
ncbi:MAG: GntR family transcriptional regulator [Actinomycetia bacterium]|nr:GntR family transcriptional regulator [Actinomycetes bacterium]MCP3909753.1 GntR family transcriptional regulator [Actinomycetes bacterium]MCP4083995.1 GntR family transcriptional regulator [Actinomycetes bacterium]